MTTRLFRRSLRAAGAGLALCGGLSLAALAGSGGTAFAQSYTTLNAASTFMAIDVNGASTAPGAGVIQWYDNGGANQHWSLPGGGSTGMIQNQNSGMCLDTDGIAGDQLFQMPCESNNPLEQWSVTENWTAFGDAVVLGNSYSGLWVDVYGNSYSAGAAIDAWYPNGQPNQTFMLDGAN
ncbi:MAG: RICIN domain-containing protein [Acidimicrobiaceae bacterium]|nr:RICIN domain-containing protein [Acidimicrobiaceae bacterium]